MTTNTLQIDRRTRERNVTRAAQFLGTLSRSPEIRLVMETAAGYTPEDHQRGWDLLLAVMGYRQGPSGAPLPQRPIDQEAAVAALDQWDAPAFERARAALQVNFPDQLAYIFDGLKAAEGPEAVGGVKAFIDRVTKLAEGTDTARAATKDQDRAAADLLAKRKILDAETEKRLRALIEDATRLAPAPIALPSIEDSPEYRAATTGLHAWLTDWRGQGRNIIRRRDYLIQLGLSERRTNAEGDEPALPEAPDSEP
jgi:hypothetical protein